MPMINGGNLEREPVRGLFTETRRQESIQFLAAEHSEKQVRVRLKFKLLYKKSGQFVSLLGILTFPSNEQKAGCISLNETCSPDSGSHNQEININKKFALSLAAEIRAAEIGGS